MCYGIIRKQIRETELLGLSQEGVRRVPWEYLISWKWLTRPRRSENWDSHFILHSLFTFDHRRSSNFLIFPHFHPHSPFWLSKSNANTCILVEKFQWSPKGCAASSLTILDPATYSSWRSFKKHMETLPFSTRNNRDHISTLTWKKLGKKEEKSS